MKTTLTLLLFVFGVTAFGAEKPKAPTDYHWRTYDDVSCEIQVPDGWSEAKRTTGLDRPTFSKPQLAWSLQP